MINPAIDSVPKQLWSASVQRQQEEIAQIKQTRADNYMEIRNRYMNVASVKPYCKICSEIRIESEVDRPMMIRYHQHASSILYRTDLQINENGQYSCQQCIAGIHYYKGGNRYPILVTSSTLADWQGRDWRARAANNYPGDPIHIDQLAINGARINDLRNALRAEYSQALIPLDILVAAGINNVINNESAEQIITQLEAWKNEVESWNSDSTFAVCTLPYPPSITSLHQDYYRHKSAVRNRDKTAVIDDLNPAITRLNQSGHQGNITSRAPKLQTWGLTQSLVPVNIDPSHHTVGRLTRHRLGQWREKYTDKQLHLDDRSRFRSEKATVGYFKRIYGLPSAPDRISDLLDFSSQPDKSEMIMEKSLESNAPEKEDREIENGWKNKRRKKKKRKRTAGV